MDEHTEKTGGNQTKIAVVVIALIVIAALTVTFVQNQNKTTTTPTTQSAPTTSQQAETPVSPAEETSSYKDGTYTAVGNYTSPGGQEELGVTVTIANGVITESDVEVMATRPISKTRQEDFAANYTELVVGKNIEEVELAKVSGSSLSPKGFNDALEKIKTEAQS